MKRKLNVSVALATTAAVALLAGAAHAQMSGAPQVCTTTQNSPAKNDCVMPTASAPGGGSFPGSFLVPGTNTSFAVHGYIQFDINRDMGPHIGDTTFGPNQGVPLSGPGVTTAGNGGTAPYNSTTGHSLNGGTSMTVKATRPNIETRTPTAYGELKTYVEFDFNQTGGTQLGGNNDVLRLRQAYGTLGPWLIGQTYSLFADAQAYADTAAGAQDIGMMDTFNVRRPMIRYTWLAGNGLTFAGGVEEQAFPSNSISVGADSATALSGVALNGTSVYWNVPRFILAGEWDQPWGHVKLAGAFGSTDVRQANITAGGTATTPNEQIGDGAVTLSGHLNTWGKDALRGGVTYNDGAMDMNSWVSQGSAVVNNSTGVVRVEKAWSFYGNYEHFFNGHWRANAAGGWMKVTGNPFSVACTSGALCPQGGLVSKAYTVETNVIYSPVPQTDFIFEWQRGYRKMMSGATGTEDRLDGEFKFYF